jgi:hypothetical protein
MTRIQKIEEAISNCTSRKVLRLLNLAWWKAHFKEEKNNEGENTCQLNTK